MRSRTECRPLMDLSLPGHAAHVQGAWAEAFAKRDVERLASLYTHDAAFYGSAPQLFLGREGVRRYFAALSPRFKTARFGTASITVLAPTALAASGPVEFTTVEDGVHTVLPYRMTHVLRLLDGTWLIAAHHASPVPVPTRDTLAGK